MLLILRNVDADRIVNFCQSEASVCVYKDVFKKLLNSNQNIKVKKYKGFLYELDISFIFYYHFVKKMPLKCTFGYQKLIIMKGILYF